MQKKILSATFGIWLSLMTILPASGILAATVVNDMQTKTPPAQCQTNPPKPGGTVLPCIKPNDVSWNS